MTLSVHNNSTVTQSSTDDRQDNDDDVVPTVVYYSVATILTFTCSVGTILNGIALFVFARNKYLLTPTNSYIMALCACDLLMCMLGMPTPIYHSWNQTAIKSQTICTIDGFSVFFLGLSSMYLMAAISVDRYVMIVRPLAAAGVTQRMASLIIVVCFLGGLFWTVMPLLGWNRYVPEGIAVACSISWQPGDNVAASYIVAIFIFCLVLPLLIMSFCYMNIYRVMRNIARKSPWGPKSHVALKNLRLEKKILKTIVAMLGAFLVSWTPYSVVSLTEAFSGQDIAGPVLETFPAIIAKVSAIWNPIIYIATNSQFRRALIEMGHCNTSYLADNYDVCHCCRSCLLPLSNNSETAMDPESRAVLEEAMAQRQNQQHAVVLNESLQPSPRRNSKEGSHHLETRLCLEKRVPLDKDNVGDCSINNIEMTPLQSCTVISEEV